jgi:hypothetical protein
MYVLKSVSAAACQVAPSAIPCATLCRPCLDSPLRAPRGARAPPPLAAATGGGEPRRCLRRADGGQGAERPSRRSAPGQGGRLVRLRCQGACTRVRGPGALAHLFHSSSCTRQPMRFVCRGTLQRVPLLTQGINAQAAGAVAVIVVRPPRSCAGLHPSQPFMWRLLLGRTAHILGPSPSLLPSNACRSRRATPGVGGLFARRRDAGRPSAAVRRRRLLHRAASLQLRQQGGAAAGLRCVRMRQHPADKAHPPPPTAGSADPA